jgi:hypothetical protein
LSSIHDLLDELLGTFAAHRPPRRVSPSQLAALQGRLDQVIGTIDDIVATTCWDGQALLAGRWRIALSSGPAAPKLLLTSVATDSLGNAAKVRLADTRSGGAFDLSRAPLADICEVVAHARAQVALQKRQLAAFVSVRASNPDAADVAAENRAAAAQATSDPDLVFVTGQFTRGHLLADAQSAPRGR